MPSVYEFTAEALDGYARPLAEFRGQVLLIVNVASRCGFTPQYAGLEALHRTLGPRGLAVLGFPCDQFGHQEPGSAAEIREFCTLNYAVSFPLFAKIAVNGADTHPLYAYLKHARRGLLGTERIKWNFTKFLLDRGGRVVARYAPTARPAALEADIGALL
jgi:glutathione peroxidase